MTGPRRFLTARWEQLAMLNYEIEPALLRPLVPAGTELDMFHGRTYVSIVGFMFRDTRVLGFAVPWHRTFPEVNLRFYVVRDLPEERRRGVAFIREIVPRAAVTLVARHLYNENYITLPMRSETASPVETRYHWRLAGRWQGIEMQTTGQPRLAEEGSLAEFITEHYWGYSAQPDGTAMEYRVEHPRWRIWHDATAQFDGDVARLYGSQFEAPLRREPASVFLCDGSAVSVYAGQRLGPAGATAEVAACQNLTSAPGKSP